MNQTLKNFWAHRRQNTWIVIEIALVAVLSFYFLDYLVVTAYDTYLCRPAGEFEREHLLVGNIGTLTADLSSVVIGNNDSDTARLKPFDQAALQKTASQKALRDQVRALPEVLSASLTDYKLGDGISNYPKTYCVESDTTKWCNAFPVSFFPGEQFFETLGLTPIEGSPSAAQLSADCPEDGAVVTHSMALTLFGTDQVIGRRIVEMDYSDEALQDGNGPKVLSRYAIAGVVEDFRLHPHERHAFSIIIPSRVVGDYAPKLLVRLRPEADPVAFINRLTLPGDIKAGNQSLAYFETYTDFRNDQNYNRDTVIFSIMGTFIALLLLNVVLGTLGTFWLQIRKRTEDIGIMRSFGAKRRHIFGMLWREAALLTLIACVFGQSIWFQFAMNIGLAEGYSRSGTGQDADWVSTFWQHFLIVSAVQYVLLLAIVTLGMVVPTLIAMYKRPVEALRYE